MNTLKFVMILLVITLTGCGGSESTNQETSTVEATSDTDNTAAETSQQETETSSEENNQTDTSSEQEETNEDDGTADDINGADDGDANGISTGFDFRSVITVDLKLDVTAITDTKSYVSLCHYKDVSALEIDYENCLLRSSTNMGTFDSSFSAAPHFENLGLVVWFVNTDFQPVQFNVSREDMDSGLIELVAGIN